MASFSKLGVILTSVFGVILLGLVAELYYFFWWKKKSNKNPGQKKHSNWLLSFLFWRKNPISAVNNYSTEEVSSTVEANGRHEQEKEEKDLEAGNGHGRQTLLNELVEEGVESELIRLHNLCGPPRFLFTIKEETKEELMDQSEDDDVNGSIKGSKSRRSLNDLITDVDDATLNPIEKMAPLESFNHQESFNPLFESLTDNKQHHSSIILSKDSDSDSESLTEREFNRLRSSPPPKFKFLRDAEEKLINRLVEEAEKRGCFQDYVEEKEGSCIAFLNLNKEREKGIHQHVSIPNSGPRKVLPLATSPPSTFTPLVKNIS